MDVKQTADGFRADFTKLRAEVNKIIVGYEDVVDGVLTALFVGGNCLLEGVPGLGKTLLVKTLGQALDLKFSRIQFTPDLMPADVIGTNIVMETPSGERIFQFQQGPVFAQIVLADEINRATPKTQSALLEAMQEHTVTVAGKRHPLEEPFLVIATQNPLEMEGTYPLPEAQLDRFLFKLNVSYSGLKAMCEILNRTTEESAPKAEKVMDGRAVESYKKFLRGVVAAPHVKEYAVRLVLATHPKGEYAIATTDKFVRYGASPRAAQALLLGAKVKAVLEGRYNVGFSDIQKMVLPAMRHRLILNFEGEAEGITPDAILKEIVSVVPTEPVETARV